MRGISGYMVLQCPRCERWQIIETGAEKQKCVECGRSWRPIWRPTTKTYASYRDAMAVLRVIELKRACALRVLERMKGDHRSIDNETISRIWKKRKTDE